jgi:hypothetical protein
VANAGTFKPGNKASAKGREVERILQAIVDGEERTLGDGSRIRIGLNAVLDKFAEGDPWAVGYVTDRLDGKAKQAMELTGSIGLHELGVLAHLIPDES